MTSISSLRAAIALTPVMAAASLLAQNNVLTVNTPMKVSGKRGESIAVKLSAHLNDGYHCNSDKPSDEYMIPLKLTWNKDTVETQSIVFPPPKHEKYAFAERPLAVYTGSFDIESKLKILPHAPTGPGLLTAKLRYQACTDKMCLPPKTIDVKIPFEAH